MSGDEELPTLAGHDHAHAALRSLGDDAQRVDLVDIAAPHLGMAAVRHHKHVVEATEDGQQGIQRCLWEDAEALLLQRMLGHLIEMVQGSLSGPTDIERGGDMGACPVKDTRDLLPVFHILESHLLDRGTGDDHAVPFLLAEDREVLVEHLHVLDGRVLRCVAAQLHEVDLNLQRRVAQQSDQIGLSSDLQWHEIENHDLQRTNHLRMGAAFVHDEDILMLQNINGR